MKKLFLPTIGLCCAASAIAGTPAQDAFNSLKKLEGTWVGKAGASTSKVIYKTTGGGSAVVETQFPGTSHEMVTVYHLDGSQLVLTHYCAAQNQPKMKLVAGKNPKVLSFDFVSGSNMKPKDAHMHSMRMTLKGEDHIVSEWTMWQDGKPGAKVSFDLTREK